MIKSVDEKFKDASPESTLAKIKDILQRNGLSVTEHWGVHSVSNCYALRITIDGTSLGSNGKGVTEALARASAYAELMERLQANQLGYGPRRMMPDSKKMNKKELMESCDDFLERTAAIIQEFYNTTLTPQQLAQFCYDYEAGDELTLSIPFYNATDDKITWLPNRLIGPLYHTTGLCAGNSPEEAIVQGFSEIIERWCQRNFMCKALVPPTIPDDYLKTYPLAWETICQIRENGYTVLIKDCSMGCGYPVIATVVIDKNAHTYHAHLGASPVFEIALERSLTETFQGREIKSVAKTSLTDSIKSNATLYSKSFRHGEGIFPTAFFTENSSFPFVPFPNRGGCSNRELLKYVMDFLREKGMKLYVRDISCLGFHSYKLIVPDMCSSDFNFLLNPVSVPWLTGDTVSVRNNPQNATQDQLYELQMLNLFLLNNRADNGEPTASVMANLPLTNDPKMDRVAGSVLCGYVEWMCGNQRAARQHAQRVGFYAIPGISDFFSCWLHADSRIRNGEAPKTVLEELAIFYQPDTITQVKETLRAQDNPFTPYLSRCTPYLQDCDSCIYNPYCCARTNRSVTLKINDAVLAFDHEKAFADLKAVFSNAQQ